MMSELLAAGGPVLLAIGALSFAAWTLIPGKGGVFNVSLDGELIWNRKEQRRFPELTELKQLVRDRVAPGAPSSWAPCPAGGEPRAASLLDRPLRGAGRTHPCPLTTMRTISLIALGGLLFLLA